MTLQAYLNNLRGKSERTRKHVAFWSSFGITAIIFTFWLASFTAAGKGAQTAVAQAVDKAGSPAQSLTASVGAFFGDIKDMIFKPRKVTYGDVQVMPGK